MAEIGQDIGKARAILERSGLVAIPTETVYGLAGNALNPEAIARIFKVKNRPTFDPLIVHADSLSKVEEFVEEIPEKALLLAERFWPGPLTLLLNKKKKIPDLVTSGMKRVAVRIPAHPITLKLLENLTFPLAAPSANPFGYISPTKVEHVRDQLGNKIEYILDGGNAEIGIESTIIGFENGVPFVYRLGGISLEKIQSVIGKVEVHEHSTSDPRAPGMLKSHYAPKKKVILGNIDDMINEYPADDIGILSFKDVYFEIEDDRQITLSESGDLTVAAKNLFSALRKLDKLPIKIILAEKVPDHGLGRAINDRLKRAAVK
ncbi:MAG: L-threonylcarbamoyladenylate synthase [Bacteroidota bacterium]